MIRKLLVVLALVVAWIVLRPLLRSASRPAGRPGGPAGPPSAPDGELVRDRVCQTYLPRARALVVRDEDGEHFFCSEACRKAFLDRGALPR